jgi:predicted 3-demethylubiquinone-9 3-methyltransferase (glyoxalase superfamily)
MASQEMGDVMQKITSCIWFENTAEEAVNFYTSIFKNSKIGQTARYGESASKVSGRPKGSVMTIAFELAGSQFLALNGGPEYKPTPATSFFVSCKTEQEVEQLYNKLSEGGTVLMPLDKYPFSDKFAWIDDRYGISWQLFCAKEGDQKISPFLMFANERQGKAEEAMKFYTSIFDNSRIISIARFEAGEPGEGTVKHGKFTLAGVEFGALDSPMPHAFTFSGAISFIVNCDTQAEIDKFWQNLPADGGQTIQCGWLTDKYGVTWQINPSVLPELMKDEESAERVMGALIKMTKLDIQTLKDAASKTGSGTSR